MPARGWLRVLAAVAAVTVIGAASGCGGTSPGTPDGTAPKAEPPLFHVQPAPALATSPVWPDGRVPRPSGLFASADWPRACAVLDNAGLSAVLPESGDTRRTPRPGELPVNRPPWDDPITVPEMSCMIETTLAEPGSPPERQHDYSVNLRISVAGTEEVLRAAQPGYYAASEHVVLGGVPCIRPTGLKRITCTTSSAMFTLTQMVNSIPTGRTIRYEAKGQVRTFGPASNSADQSADFESDVVLPELAVVVAHNLSAKP